MTTGERIKYLRKEILHIKNSDTFASKINMSGSNLRSIENNLINVKNKVIKDISEKYNINENWLLTGEGEIFMEPTEIKSLSTKYNLSNIEALILKNYLKMNEPDRKMFVQLLVNLTHEAPNSNIIPFTSDAPKTELVADDTGIMPQASHSVMKIQEVGYDNNQDKIKADIDELE